MECFAGIDVGASTTKAVILNHAREVVGHAVNDSGADFEAAAERAYETACDLAGCGDADVRALVSTGYGRRNVPRANDTRTEISCHAEGSYFHFSRAHTLVDIGGQDCKVMRINDAGKRTGFKMNRKCAAGTGAFLEEIAYRLKIDLGKLNDFARQAEHAVQIGSYCTVFTGTEILSKIREGVKVPDIVKGVFSSVLKRVLEMDPIEGDLVMTGGVVAHNSYLVEMFEQQIDKKIYVPPLPQLTGAFGAALFALSHGGDQDA